MYGFHNRLLHVDLGTGRHRWEESGEGRLRSFVGGIGLGTSLLYDFAPPGVEPLAPENPLIFASAPLAGTGLTTTAKYAVVTKSPLTGFIADSLSSSFFALELKAVGVDAVVVTGRAPAPSYLFIGNDGVEFRDASRLWGRSAADTEAAIRAELGNDAVRVAAVG
ncbi:MAG: aldehyde:ferredoxin oxidoreductase, partial [Deltaproteobacteria bacterium]|nr:aldehyde:ferredoxin oxidoreductase [Deltaproteobacteria bacterium]